MNGNTQQPTEVTVQQAERLQAALQRCGWTLSNGDAVASKAWETACGPKSGHVYLYPAGRLYANYESEGRNVLATVLGSVSGRSEEAIDEEVKRFTDEVQRCVDQSYARHLWLIGVRSRSAIQSPAASTA